jgi:N-acetylmuramic acid 6-phosphate (MurNAc-6-P) etherase
LRAATDLDEQAASGLLVSAGGELKTAIVMARSKVDASRARELLRRSGGHVRAALEGP